MQIKLLTDLVEELAGEGNGKIVGILFGKKDVNEFSLAKKMEMTINQVRNILYKLSGEGLVTFIRKKDKRKGWYIYYWTLKTEKCLIRLEKSLIKKIDDYKNLLGGRQTERFYICQSCAIEVTEEKALENGFSCEECAEVYELSDSTKQIRETKGLISKTEKDLELIRNELKQIREKESKKRARIDKKNKKEEDKKKGLLKKARALARKKIAGGKVKKVVKKKSSKKAVKKKVASKKTKITKRKNTPSKKIKKILKNISRKVKKKRKI